jgi:hypothetical protein
MRDTSQVGEICRTQVIAALTLQGKRILVPLGDYQRYDLVIEEEDGRFLRVQCKNGHLINGAIVFHCTSVDSRSVPGRCVRKKYAGQIEFFGVFCPENGKCYLIPADAVTGYYCYLRVDPPRNGQKTRIRWAKDYELRRELDQETKQRLELEEFQTLF